MLEVPTEYAWEEGEGGVDVCTGGGGVVTEGQKLWNFLRMGVDTCRHMRVNPSEARRGVLGLRGLGVGVDPYS